ncbi:hypothetical protein JCM8097_005455 [Rhodosporidiobolus ruineniae]
MANGPLTSSPQFTALKQAVDLALSDDFFSGWSSLASRALGFLSGPAHLLDSLEKVANGTTTDKNACKSLIARVHNALLVLEEYEPRFAPAQQAQADHTAEAKLQDERVYKELQGFKAQVMNKSFTEEETEAQAIKWLNVVINRLSPAARMYQENGDVTRGIPPTYPADPKGNLEVICLTSSSRFVAWWNSIGKNLSWEQCLEIANSDTALYSTSDESTVFSEFDLFAQSFDWNKEYASKTGGTITPAAEFALKLSAIINKSPAHLAGQNDQWAYAKSIKAALPSYVLTNIAKVSSSTNTKELLKEIGNVNKDVFERAKHEAEEQEAKIQSLVERSLSAMRNEMLSLSRRASAPRAPSPPRYQPVKAKPARPTLPTIVAASAADAPRSSPPNAPFALSRFEAGMTPDMALAVEFPDSDEGRKQYTKAMAAFEQEFPGEKAASAPITARFPLTPGSWGVPSYSCDRCGQPGHCAGECTSSKPLPEGERNYRRIWRIVIAQNRKKGRLPGFARPSAQRRVNLIADIDELMLDHPFVFYAGDTDDNPAEEDEPFIALIMSKSQGKVTE